MAKFVPDVRTQRWVIIAPDRGARPFQSREKEKSAKVFKKGEYLYRGDCPFCFGNEAMTPPEVYRWGKHYPSDTDWVVRVVPNKYPITDTHEIIVHSPDHRLDLVSMTPDQILTILKVFRERFQALSTFGQVLIFNNSGARSGESLVHPHSQVVVFPQQIKLDVLPIEPVRNIVDENDFFITYCPDFSQWPYEVWIADKGCLEIGRKEGCTFGIISDEKLTDLAKIMKRTLQKLYALFADLSYNFYIAPGSSWYLRIIPRLTERAGLELGTGVHVNPVDPGKAAESLKEVISQQLNL